MFTGIIEERGVIQKIDHQANITHLTIGAEDVLSDVALGDSIAVNGVCLTVTEFGADYFNADIMPETLKRTGFSQYKSGQMVNLERALRMGDRLGGHLVSGHIDGVATLTNIDYLGDVRELTFTLNKPHGGLIIPKGSITIDGISLTIISVTATTFSVGIIPHTYEATNLSTLKVGESVNIEFDLFGKFVFAREEAKENQLDLSQLDRWGY